MIEMNNVEQDDRKLKEMLKHNHASVEIPKGKESWLQVQAKLKKRSRRKMWLRRIKISTAVIACSFVISFFLNYSFPSVYATMATLFKKVQGELIEIFHEDPEQDSTRAKTLPPEEELHLSDIHPGSSLPLEKTGLEDAKNKLAFTLLIPSYIPEKFNLDAVFITKETSGMYNDVYLEYIDHQTGELLKISQRKIEGKTGAIKTDINHSSGDFFDVYVGEYPAIVFVDHQGNMASLEWLTKDRIKVYISGPITKEDVIKIGRSLK